MSNYTKRIRILPENELDDLFSKPIFNEDERTIWFDLNQNEHELLKSKKILASKVDFVLQLGYFKAKHQFFNFTLEDVYEDSLYILDRFFSGETLIKTCLSREQRRRN